MTVLVIFTLVPYEPRGSVHRRWAMLVKKCSMVISCFADEVTSVWIREKGHKRYGVLPPGPHCTHWRVTHKAHREADWAAIAPEVMATLNHGERVYMHCRSGVHRAAMAAAIVVAWITGCSFEEALRIVESKRAVDFPAVLGTKDNGAFARQAATLRKPVQAGVIDGYAHANSGRYAHAMVAGVPACRWRKSKQEQRALFSSGIQKAKSLQDLAAGVRGVCKDCVVHMPGSHRALAMELLGTRSLG